MDDSSNHSRAVFRLRLGDLTIAVVGSAFVFDVARRSRGAWGGGMPDQIHLLGLIVLALGSGLGLLLLGQGVRIVRETRREGRVWALTWRGLALGGLGWFLAEVATVLQYDRAMLSSSLTTSIRFEMELIVAPLATTLGLVGLVLAASPMGRRRGPGSRPGVRSRVFVILAAATALAIVATGYGVMPYLVLLALEAVRNALTRAPLEAVPHLFDRLARAGLETLPALAGCVLTAFWVDDDLRVASSDPDASRVPRSWAGVIGRGSTIALAAFGSAFLLLSTIPRLSPPLAEGIESVFQPLIVATLALGCAGLAGGISARAAACLVIPREPTEPTATSGAGRWAIRIVGALACLVPLEIIAAAVQSWQGDETARWYAPIRLADWPERFDAVAQWLGYPGGSQGLNVLLDHPGMGLIAVAAIWLAWRMIGLIARATSAHPSAIDVVATDRLARGRFVGWWLGLTTLILASLPTLAVAAVVVTHHLIQWVVD